MRYLFALPAISYLRHFESVVELLAGRGHRVTIAVSRLGDRALPESFRDSPQVALVAMPDGTTREYSRALTCARLLQDYSRYHTPRFARAATYRRRALQYLLESFGPEAPDEADISLPDVRLPLAPAAHDELSASFQALERLVPPDADVLTFLQREAPDLVFVTPFVFAGVSQAETVKAAAALDIPTVFGVFSWDNLTNKGVSHVTPDVALVWNETQRRELVELHRISSDRIITTGTPRFDDFFALTPSQTREEFCRRYKCDPTRPIVTYLCSSAVVSPREQEFFARWIAAARTSTHAALRDCNIVVRPHPRNRKEWRRWVAEQGFPDQRVALVSTKFVVTDQVLFNCLFHSVAVVGLNTSAQIEAAILGKPVCTVLAPDDAPGQEGSLHFDYLLRANGGFVDVDETLDAHLARLAALVDDPPPAGAYDDAVRRFVRPHGLTRPVAPIMADVLEHLAARRVPEVGPSSLA